MSDEFRHRLRVRYGECDPQGVVYFARYSEFVDIGLTELWRERVSPWDEMVQGGSDMVVAELQLRYRAAARFDDELDIALAIDRLGETSIVFAFRIERDGDCLVDGTIRQVCIDPATRSKKALPPDVRAALA
jgi:acyl-CoA thioester hydrolase